MRRRRARIRNALSHMVRGRRLMRNRCLYMVALQTELWRRGVLG